MRILVSFRGIPQSPGWATGDLVAKAFQVLGHETFVYAKVYQQNQWLYGQHHANTCLQMEYDLVLFLECNDGDRQYAELRRVRTKQFAGWFFDASYHQDRYRRLVDGFGFDHIFLANPLVTNEYTSWGYDRVHTLPYACDPELHSRPLETVKKSRCSLVGSVRANRKALGDLLARNGLRMDLIGGQFREAYIDALASSETIVNQNPDAGYGLYNMRQFEAPAAGAIILTEERDYDVNPDVFQDGLNCLVYESPQDLVEIMRMLEHEPDFKETVRSAGQNHVLTHHTYEARCRQILNTVFPHAT